MTDDRKFCRTCVGELIQDMADFCSGPCTIGDLELSKHMGYLVNAHERVVEASRRYTIAAKANDPKVLERAMDVTASVYALERIERDTHKSMRRKDELIQERRLRERK